jgi:hypothetical protein
LNGHGGNGEGEGGAPDPPEERGDPGTPATEVVVSIEQPSPPEEVGDPGPPRVEVVARGEGLTEVSVRLEAGDKAASAPESGVDAEREGRGDPGEPRTEPVAEGADESSD